MFDAAAGRHGTAYLPDRTQTQTLTLAGSGVTALFRGHTHSAAAHVAAGPVEQGVAAAADTIEAASAAGA